MDWAVFLKRAIHACGFHDARFTPSSLVYETLSAFVFTLVGMINTASSKTLIRQLEADGWVLVRVKGSHHQFKHPIKPGLVTVKHPARSIPIGTLLNIARQAGWRQ